MQASVVVLLALGCTDTAGDSAAEPPDVSGRYQVFVETVSGCDNDASLVQPWAQAWVCAEKLGEVHHALDKTWRALFAPAEI